MHSVRSSGTMSVDVDAAANGTMAVDAVESVELRACAPGGPVGTMADDVAPSEVVVTVAAAAVAAVSVVAASANRTSGTCCSAARSWSPRAR